jgi:uncharacterized protein (DUF58 family)
MDVWNDKRLKLSITRLGIEYLAAMLLMGLFAVDTGNNLLYLVFSMMLGLFLVSGWVSRRAIQGMALEAIEEGNLFARVQGGIKVRLRDRAPGRPRGLEIHLVLEQGWVEPAFYPGAAPGPEEHLVVLQAHPERRGACRALRLDLRTAYPFGFLEKAWSFPLEKEMLVLPHPRSFTQGPGWEGELGRARLRPGSSSPDGARPFKERDPLSRVHWKRTAQRGTPWVRTFEDEQPSGLSLRLDLKGWDPGPAFERELECLSGGILRARLQRREITLRVEGKDGEREYQGYTPSWRALGLAAAEGGTFHAAGRALP